MDKRNRLRDWWRNFVFTLTCRWLWFRYNRLGQPITCMHDGCTQPGEPCYLPLEKLPAEYYCREHMDKHGYCYGCGLFWAGCEEFDFSPAPGLCPNCRDEFERDEDWYDPEMDFGDYDPYGPYGDDEMLDHDDEPACVECGEPACGGGVCSVCFQPMCDGCIEMCCGVCNQHDENGKPLVLADVDDPLTDSVPVEDGTWQCKHPDGSSTTLREADTAGWERVVCPDCGAHWVVWNNVVAGQRQAIPVIVPVYEEEANDE